MVNYERELQINSTESRIIEFGLDFAKKLKIEVGRNFWTKKSQNWLKLNQIKILIWIEIKHDRKVDYEKSLPLIPNSDQIDAIKLLNRLEHEERDVEIQALISPNLLNQISNSNAPEVWKWV